MRSVDRAVGIVAQTGFDGFTRGADDLFLAGFDGLHIDADLAGEGDAVEGGTACHVGGIGAGDQGLGGDAAGVDAGSAEEMALDEGDLHAGLSERSCEGRAGLTGSDDDGVEFGHWSWV